METGTWIVAASALTAVAAALLLRSRVPAPLVAGVLMASGAGIGWGGMLIQPHPSIGELVAAVTLLAILVPAHVRIVLGPFGPRG